MAVLKTAYGLTSHREQTLHRLKRNNRGTKRTTETPPPRHVTVNRIRLSYTGPSEMHNFVRSGQKRRNAVRKSAHVNEQARQMLVINDNSNPHYLRKWRKEKRRGGTERRRTGQTTAQVLHQFGFSRPTERISRHVNGWL